MLPEIWQKEIINIDKEVDWVEETSKQLIKDFTMLGISIELKPFINDPYKGLFGMAKQIITQLFEKDHARFLDLLYRIDLPETELNNLIHTTSPPELYDKITELILRREFLKVVTRYKYMDY